MESATQNALLELANKATSAKELALLEPGPTMVDATEPVQLN